MTEICNLKCKHCFARSEARHMEYALFTKIVDDLYDIYKSGSTVCFMGGEPLLYTRIMDAVYYAAGKDMKISLTTNGYRTDPGTLKKIVQAGETIISVSLDGPEAFHNENRGKSDSYKEVIKTIDCLATLQGRFVISAPFFKQTIHFLDFFDTLLEKYNCTLRFSRFVPVGKGEDIRNKMASRKDFQLLFSYARSRNESAGRFRVDVMDPFFNHPMFGMRSCKCGRKIAFVNTDGTVWPCWRMQLSMGNIKNEHLKDILKNPVIDDYLDESKIKGICAQCKHKSVCRGGCHAVPYTLYGDYHLEDPQCPLFEKEQVITREEAVNKL